ncbi:MAG: ribosome maturation factor RimP [Acidobacteria bacterium]|nr:ribosome maturation factor RimP [Acidobacteriota bacterium]
MKHSIDERIREITVRTAEENGLEVVQVEIGGSTKNPTVRVFIDKPGGVTHENCSTVSRRIETLLDDEDFLPPAYLLEVSSPGLERKLYNLKDFERFAGNLAKVKINQTVDGQKNFRGRIIGVEGEEIIFEDKTKGTVRFPYSAVAKANLEIDLQEELKRNG